MIRIALTTLTMTFALGCASPREVPDQPDAPVAADTTQLQEGMAETPHPSPGGEPHTEHAQGAPDANHHPGMHRHGDGGQPQEGPRPPIGEVVRSFDTKDSAGIPFRLDVLRRTEDSSGTIAVLTFWCTTCSSCRGVEREFDKKAKEYESKGVQFFMVDSNHTDNADRVNQFLERHALGFPVLMDSESTVARYFGAKLTTTTAVIDVNGRLRYYGSFRSAEVAVQDLLAGREVTVPESRSVG